MNVQDEAAYKAYFESLATSHNDITFFFFGDDETAIKVSRSEKNTSNFALWLDYYPPITSAGEYDTNMGTMKAEFAIIKPASSRNITREQLQAITKECEDIMQQFIARILYDYSQATDPSDVPLYSTIQFGRMEPATKGKGATQYEGVLGSIDFLIPLKLDFDQTKWS